MDFMRKQWKKVALAGGVAAVIVAGIWFVKRKRLDDEEENDETQVPTSEIVSRIKVKRVDNVLSLATVKRISQAVRVLVSEGLGGLVFAQRKERRAAEDNEKYAQVVMKFVQNQRNLTTGALDAVLSALDLTKSEYMGAVDKYVSEGNQGIISSITTSAALPPSKEISQEKLKEITNSQLEYLKLNSEELKKFAKIVNSAETFSLIIRFKISDFTFQKFDVEDEDVFVALEKYNASGQPDKDFNNMRASLIRLVSIELPQEAGFKLEE